MEQAINLDLIEIVMDNIGMHLNTLYPFKATDSEVGDISLFDSRMEMMFTDLVDPSEYTISADITLPEVPDACPEDTRSVQELLFFYIEDLEFYLNYEDWLK